MVLQPRVRAKPKKASMTSHLHPPPKKQKRSDDYIRNLVDQSRQRSSLTNYQPCSMLSAPFPFTLVFICFDRTRSIHICKPRLARHLVAPARTGSTRRLNDDTVMVLHTLIRNPRTFSASVQQRARRAREGDRLWHHALGHRDSHRYKS